MSFVLLHADRSGTLLSDDPIVPADEVTRFGEVATLLAAATTLRERAAEASDAAARDARERGYEAGFAQGRAAADAALADEIAALARRDAERAETQRSDLAALATEVVRRIAGEIGAPGFVAALAARAASDVAGVTGATVRVHPDALAATADRLANREGIAVEADGSLGATDCVLETAAGRTIAGLDAQIERLEQAWGVAR